MKGPLWRFLDGVIQRAHVSSSCCSGSLPWRFILPLLAIVCCQESAHKSSPFCKFLRGGDAVVVLTSLEAAADLAGAEGFTEITHVHSNSILLFGGPLPSPWGPMKIVRLANVGPPPSGHRAWTPLLARSRALPRPGHSERPGCPNDHVAWRAKAAVAEPGPGHVTFSVGGIKCHVRKIRRRFLLKKMSRGVT